MSTTPPKKPSKTRETSGTPEDQRVPIHEKLAYGGGSFAEKIIFDQDKQLANPVLNTTLHVDTSLVGLGLAIPRLWDAITDPLMGIISDRFSSRWGRRRPFIFVGAFLVSLFLLGLWFFPRGMSTGFYFGYFVALSLCYYTAVTIWSVPYQALGYEMTGDYHERTRVQGFRAFFNGCGNFLVPWMPFFAHHEIFGGDTILGLRVVVGIAAIVALVFALSPALFIKERQQIKVSEKKPPPTNIFREIRSALQSPAFRRLIFMVFLIQIGGYTVAGMGYFVMVYHVFGGLVKDGLKVLALTQSVYYTMVILAAPAMVFLSTRIGKLNALYVCCGLGLLGSLLKWVCYTPAFPYLALLVPVFLAPGYSAIANLFFHSIVADICDEDELHTGKRREGVYGSVAQWILKMGQSCSFFIAGVTLTFVGFDAALGGNQPEGALTKIRLVFAFLPAMTFIAGFLIMWRFPIRAETAHETRRILDARRKQNELDRSRD